MLFKGLITAAGLLATSVKATIYYAGVAESGGEFGAYGKVGTGLPGRFGVDYSFISKPGIDVYVDQNKVRLDVTKSNLHIAVFSKQRLINVNQVNLFRVAFLLERMCPLATGLGAAFNETVSFSNTFLLFPSLSQPTQLISSLTPIQHFSSYADAINYITVTKSPYA